MGASRIAFALGASLLLASVCTSAQQLIPPQTKTTASEVQVAGDPVKGQAIFLGKGGCLSCHRVADEGSRMGPNLSAIATERSVEELRSALLDFKPEVAPRDQLYRGVVTSDGQTITGRILNQDDFSLQILDSHEQLRGFMKSNLRESGFTVTPPMPSYRDKLTAEEQTNLIAFLSSLRGPTVREELH
jgi:putative heme-binding domain-containing protein